VYAAYGLGLIVVHSTLWTIRFVCWVIAYAAFGVTLLLVHSIWWVASVARFREGADNVRSSRADGGAVISHSTAGQGAKSVPAPQTRRPSFPDVAISVREASEALFAYERRVFCARSDVRETAARTLETIAKTQALMAQVDAAAAGKPWSCAALDHH
jgi:hypothetical protein